MGLGLGLGLGGGGGGGGARGAARPRPPPAGWFVFCFFFFFFYDKDYKDKNYIFNPYQNPPDKDLAHVHYLSRRSGVPNIKSKKCPCCNHYIDR